MNSESTAQSRMAVSLEELLAGDRILFRTFSGSEYVFDVTKPQVTAGAVTIEGQLRGGTYTTRRPGVLVGGLSSAAGSIRHLMVGGRALFFLDPVVPRKDASPDRITTTAIVDLALERPAVPSAA